VQGAGAYTVWANGELVWANLQAWRIQWNNPLFVTLPLALSRPGSTVELLLALPFRDTQGYALGSLYVGSAPAPRPGFELRRFFQRGLPFIATGVGVLMGVLSLTWVR
jgi:hypothetical protein